MVGRALESRRVLARTTPPVQRTEPVPVVPAPDAVQKSDIDNLKDAMAALEKKLEDRILALEQQKPVVTKTRKGSKKNTLVIDDVNQSVSPA